MGQSEIDVWIVEDNDFLRETLCEVLSGEGGARCTLAVPSCEDALEELRRRGAPEVVLMDLDLPGMSGIEGIARFRTMSPASQIIVLTVHEDDDKIFDALCAGASGYLLKPASSEAIMKAIHTALDGGAPINPHIARRVLSMFSGHLRPRGD